MSSAPPTEWLLLGALLGYVLMMRSNPVRENLRDGWRAVRRYPRIWGILGAFGFANAAFTLGTQFYLANVLPEAERPVFMWMRALSHDPQRWLSGSPDSLWWLPPAEVASGVRASILPALESLAGLFGNLVSSFPVSAFAALLFFMPWRRRARVSRRAMRRKFGRTAWVIQTLLVVAALGALAKPVVYASPLVTPPILWMEWGQVVAAVSFVFEFLLGVGVQVFLLLLAFGWVRGLSFRQDAMAEVAIRRFPAVLPWTAFILLLSTLLIDVPLILKNFPALAEAFPETDVFVHWIGPAKLGLSLFLILTAGVQIRLALHSVSWRQALRDHFRMIARAWWPMGWFLVIAGFHFFAWHAVRESVARGVGEGTALWVAWRLISPWLAGAVGAWLLASWVCVYKRFEPELAKEGNAAT